MIVTQFDDAFYKWGELFARSLYFTNPNSKVYMDTVNLSESQVKTLSGISPNITVSNSLIVHPTNRDVPTFMANRRVKVLLDVMNKVDSKNYMIIDADMLFRKSLDTLYSQTKNDDAAIIFRDGFWEGRIYEHLKVACGIVIVNKSGIPLIEKWDEIMTDNKPVYGYIPWAWYWDQITLLAATRELPMRYSKIDPFLYINRDFEDSACIWSANKAPKDHMYTAFSNEFERMKKNALS